MNPTMTHKTTYKTTELTVTNDDVDLMALIGGRLGRAAAAVQKAFDRMKGAVVTATPDHLHVTLPCGLSETQCDRLLNLASGMRGRKSYAESELLLRLLHSADPTHPVINHRLG